MAKKIPNDLILKENFYSFEGVAETANPKLVALEIARSWKNGAINEELLRSFGLPNGKPNCFVDDAREFFRDVYECVSLLDACGAFKNSPQIAALGFHNPNSPVAFGEPRFELISKINTPSRLPSCTNVMLATKGGDEFIYQPIPKPTINGLAYTGIADIAAENGSRSYAICAWDKCNAIFDNFTGRGIYCCSSHRVRAAQTREHS